MTDTTKRYRLKKDYVTPRFTYAKGADVAYLGGMYVIGIETFTEEALKTTPEWFEEVLPVSEPVPEKIKVLLFGFNEKAHGDTYYTMSFRTKNYIPIELCPKIKQAIESALNDTVDLEMYKLVMDNEALKSLNEQLCSHIDSLNKKIQIPLNDTVVEDKGDGIDEITKLKNYIKYLEAEFECNKDKVYTLVEVDAIRADTWYAARKITDKVVGEIDFKDGDRCPFYEKYFNSINDYLSSLNLNSNDTGKEDNETKSANWRSENLSKQSAPEPSALPTKEYEILSFSGKVANYGFTSNPRTEEWVNKQIEEGYPIHSVRRLLPDMEVFSCKDNTNKGVIESFVIITEENRQTAVTAHLDKRENIGKIAVKVSGSLGAVHPNQLLEDLEKLPPTPTQPVVEDKPVLFTTEDGVEYRDSLTDYYEVRDFKHSGRCNGMSWYRPEKGNKYFSTEEAAEQYIIDNKPCLSRNEVMSIVRTVNDATTGKDNRGYINNGLYKLIQQKLNK